MKPSMNRIAKFAITAFVAASLFPAVAAAEGYLLDSNGNIVKSGTGLCWHTSQWTPQLAVEPCDPVARPAAVAPAPEPKPVEAAVIPPAVIAVAPPAPEPVVQKISFSGDAFFDFDKAELKPEGKAKLDDLAQQLDGATYDTILVIGHTDRFGSSKYNQKLSERRAQAVKDYLLGKGIPPNRIEAKGMGETQPVTKPGECRGARSAKVTACLQPDRRVDIEVSGTKTISGSR